LAKKSFLLDSCEKGDGTQIEDPYLSTAPAYSFNMPLAHSSKKPARAQNTATAS
jgi:hypothetical protein